jgi:hypothetical protein
VPEPPVIVVDENKHERFVELVVTESVTVPLKPFRGTISIVEFPVLPEFTLTTVGFAVNVKSGAAVT